MGFACKYDHGSWKARLDIILTQKTGKTVLEHVRHEGPLRLQRPFYPEGDEICHLYLLHPPGGMVTGDALNVRVLLKKGASALVTTPSAGKIYRGDSSARQQEQQMALAVEEGALLEWVPQETIVFNGARGELSTVIDLQENSRLLLWDVLCLGRPASGEIFDSGYLVQKLLLRKQGKSVYRERNHFQGGSDLMAQAWGLAGNTVVGTCLVTCVLEESELMNLREELAALMREGVMAASQLEQLLVVRYCGHSAEECRRGFEALRAMVRPRLIQLADVPGASRPRIWNT